MIRVGRRWLRRNAVPAPPFASTSGAWATPGTLTGRRSTRPTLSPPNACGRSSPAVIHSATVR